MDLEKILARKLEIRALLEGEQECDLVALEAELRELSEAQETMETRARLIGEAATINNGGTEFRTIETFGSQEPEKRGLESMAYRNAFMDHVIRGTAIPGEFRADAITKTNDIGALIPITVLNQIIEKLTASGMILPLVTRTSVKGGVTIPTSTVKPVATWVAEGAGSEKQKKNLAGNITFNYHKLRCAVAVSLEVDTMALSVFESTLINNVTEAMVVALEQAIIKGTGVGQPKGILTETPDAGQALELTKIDYQTLIAAESALPLEYEAGAVWCMTKKTFMAFAGMVDTTGQPIARTNYGISGKPERLLMGRNVVLCNYLESWNETLEAGKVFAFLFNFNDYILNTNYQMGIKKYEDNDTDDTVTKAIMIADGKVVQSYSLVTLAKK